MSQKSAKSAAELESLIMAELREHPECESAAVVVNSQVSVGTLFWSARERSSMMSARRGSRKSLIDFGMSSI
jgi:hypothetical protein